jgi:hypothetical protein
VTSTGTVVDETKAATSTVSSTTSTPSALTNNLLASISPNQDPKIDDIKVSGSINNDMTGSGVLDNLEVTIDSKNITANNLLTPDGLHWSDDTIVIPIRGTALGTISSTNFGVDGPTSPATVYTFNPGDSGRITDVGQTLSGLKLDMLYTVVSNDAPAWQAGFTDPDPTTPQGLAFSGEQNINGADGNSIVALYYGTSQLDLLYQVVLSGTVIEAPVLASFISTDIDNGQGVTTNLNNILTVTPNTTNLQTTGNIIYDTSNQNLNGASSLPYGGYLGVGFVSHFDYHFYSPAPAMSGTSLAYSAGVRYDLFGSALQAHLITQTRVQGQIFYYDNQGAQFHNTDNFIWFPDTDVNIPMSHFDNYAQDSWEETGTNNYPVLNWHYTKLSTVTINFYGTNGVYLGSNSDTERAGTPFNFDAPNHIAYYDLISASHYSGTFGMTDQTINVYYNYNPPVIQVTREVTVEVANPNYNPDIVAALDYEAEQAAYLAANPWAGPSAHMSWEQYVSKSGMATFSTYADLGDPGSAAWYEYYAYYAEPTIEQNVVERYFTVDNGQLTPKPVSADTGGAGNFTVDHKPNFRPVVGADDPMAPWLKLGQNPFGNSHPVFGNGNQNTNNGINWNSAGRNPNTYYMNSNPNTSDSDSSGVSALIITAVNSLLTGIGSAFYVSEKQKRKNAIKWGGEALANANTYLYTDENGNAKGGIDIGATVDRIENMSAGSVATGGAETSPNESVSYNNLNEIFGNGAAPSSSLQTGFQNSTPSGKGGTPNE